MSSLLEGERCLKSEISSLLVENVQLYSIKSFLNVVFA